MSDPVKIYTNGHTVETGHPLPVFLDSTAPLPLPNGASSTDSDDKLRLVISLLLQKAADNPIWYDVATNALRVNGTVSATQSGTWNIGTVTTLTGITNIGGYSAGQIVINAMETDWGITSRSLMI